MSSHVQDGSGRKKRSPRSTTCSSRPSDSHNSEKNQHRENSSGRRNNSGKVGLRYFNYQLIDIVALSKQSTRRKLNNYLGYSKSTYSTGFKTAVVKKLNSCSGECLRIDLKEKRQAPDVGWLPPQGRKVIKWPLFVFVYFAKRPRFSLKLN